MTSLIGFLKSDDEDLLGDLMNAPRRAIRALRARIEQLDAAKAEQTSVPGLDWCDAAYAADPEERAVILADNAAELERARKAARQRLRVAELLVETRTDLG